MWMVIIGYANRMKSEQILMKSIQIIFTSFLNQIGFMVKQIFRNFDQKTSTIFWIKLHQFLGQLRF